MKKIGAHLKTRNADIKAWKVLWEKTKERGICKQICKLMPDNFKLIKIINENTRKF